MAKTGLGRRAALLLSMGFLAGCSGQDAWPFDGARAQAVAEPTRSASSIIDPPQIAGGTALLPAVRLVAAERGRQGVILRAEGFAATQGFHNQELLSVGRSEDGVETVEIRAAVPAGAKAIGPERTRLLSVARFYSNREMRDIRAFRVLAADNSVATALP